METSDKRKRSQVVSCAALPQRGRGYFQEGPAVPGGSGAPCLWRGTVGRPTHEHGVGGGVVWVEVLPDVSHQGHDHDRVDGQDVAHPAVQHPVLKDKPADHEGEMKEVATATVGVGYRGSWSRS